jgi:uncharacterized protein YndB with AHSA1/START domain
LSIPAGDVATVTVLVKVAPEEAFSIFTEEIDLWWKEGPQYRIGGRRPGRICFECGPEGRLFETVDLSTGLRTFEVGKIVEWNPPARLVFDWRGVNFKPGEKTTVEVSFQASGGGTLVTVRHSGWSALREGHPARHGLTGREFSRMIGMWWSELLTSLREHARDRARGV